METDFPAKISQLLLQGTLQTGGGSGGKDVF